ncbi:hypothetical protein ACFXPI_25810 [Streptomyces sp. NPDC059104]|uniref:hypothetical protein n=1 Tax=Streptomyces sp. NPDC059104 TaxID=3346729 RepID=UPI00367A4778
MVRVDQRVLRRSEYTAGWVGWGTPEPFDAELEVYGADGRVRRRVAVRGVAPHISHLALLDGDRFLLVSGRSCQDQHGRWADNAYVYDRDGRREGAFCIGDDVPVVVSSRRGGIWTAYGDEGIFGRHPESRGALAGWNSRGDAVWTPRTPFPAGPVHGLTGCTEGDDRVWLAWSCRQGTYLSRITQSTGEVTTFRSPVTGIDGIAVRGDRAVFSCRDHGRPAVTLTRARLVGGAWEAVAEERWRVPGPVMLHCGQGRDGVLWLRAGDSWVGVEA